MKGKNVWRPLVVGAVVLAALSAAGCAGEALRFNNALVDYNKRLAEAGKKYGETLAPALQGGRSDPAQVKAAYNRVVSTLDEVKKEFAALQVPNSTSGKRLAEAYQKFLQNQESMIKNQFAQLRQMEETGPPNAGQMKGLLQEVGRLEQSDLAEVQRRQQEFARDNGITLRSGQ